MLKNRGLDRQGKKTQPPSPSTAISERLFQEYLAALLAGDKITCVRIVESLLETNVAIRSLYEDLFRPSLYRIGEMWESNRITVAVEHLATSITQQLMNLVYPRILGREKTGRIAVIACIANEYHQIGARMVADVFEINGWDSYFLGSNTPVNDLLAFLDSRRPHALGLSLAIYFNMPDLCRTVDAVRGGFPDLPILVGGQAFRWGGREIGIRDSGMIYIDSISELERRMAGGRFEN